MYKSVSSHFTDLFETLFPGGEGRLRLTDPNDLLETGLLSTSAAADDPFRVDPGG